MHSARTKLRQTVESFVSYIDSLPPEQVKPATWGPREVLVHLVFWHETFCATIEALLNQNTPVLPQGTFADLNAAAVRANATVSIGDLVKRFLSAQDRLEQLSALAQDKDLAVPVKAGSRTRTVEGLLAEAEAHIRNHELKLRRKARRQ